MYCLMTKTKVNWVNVIREHIFKVNKKLEYCIPYVVLLSSFIEYFEIDIEGEVIEEVKSLDQISAATLNKIGLRKVNNKKWVYKADEDTAFQEDEGAETSAVNVDDDVAKTDMNYDQFAKEGEIPAALGQDSYSRFEQLMINQLNTMENENQSPHQYCETHFQFIETQVEDIQSKIGKCSLDRTIRTSIAYLVGEFSSF